MQNNTFSTLFVGQNLIRLLAVDSTNDFLKSLMSNSEPLPEGTVIMADEQFAGRGQQTNHWLAEPGKNLTFSLLLKPSFLAVDKQFLLNMAVSIAINKALTKFLPEGLKVKWPNDVYFGTQKIGGVLIENTIVGSKLKTSVIGIGINVNQAHFDEKLAAKASSLFQILQRNVNLLELLAEICKQIEYLYLQLRTGNYTGIRSVYIEMLYKMSKPSLYRQNGEVFEGVITGVSDLGLLQMDRQGMKREFNFKEIEFLNLI